MIDINTYLTKLSAKLIIPEDKIQKIEISINTLKAKLWSTFQDKLEDVTVFGSYDRETIIFSDDELDVDILIIFKKKEFTPQTYLNQLRYFCEENYQKSEISPDHPTIALNLNHIKLELVPCYKVSANTVRIPAPTNFETKWIESSPNENKTRLETKNKTYKNLLLPLIRIMKYWNLLQDSPFISFELERFICNLTFGGSNLEDYYFQLGDTLTSYGKTDLQKKSVAFLQERNRRLKALKRINILDYFEQEFSLFLPIP